MRITLKWRVRLNVIIFSQAGCSAINLNGNKPDNWFYSVWSARFKAWKYLERSSI